MGAFSTGVDSGDRALAEVALGATILPSAGWDPALRLRSGVQSAGPSALWAARDEMPCSGAVPTSYRRHSFACFVGAIVSNNRFERSRGRVFGEPRRGSMIGIKCLRLALAKPRVAQPHR